MADQVTTPQQAVAPTPTALPTNSANVQQFLQSYQPTASEIYSPTNVQQATTQPQSAPNMSDPLQLYSYYMNTPEVTAAQKSYQDLSQKLSQFDTATQKANLGLENQTVSMNVIRGEQAQLGQQAAVTRQSLANEVLVAQSALEAARQTAQDKLNIALQQRDQLTQLITQYPGAKISYADTVEEAAKKINKYQKKQEEESYNKELKSQLIQLGISTKTKKGGTLNTKGMEKALKNYYADQSEYNKQIQQLDLAAKRKSLSGGVAAGASNELSAVAKVYKQTGGDWGKTADILANQGYDVSSGSVIDNELRRRNGLEPITTGGKAPNQQQLQAASFATRLQSSGDILNKYDQLGSENIGYLTGQGWFPNFLKSSERQQMEQAQRDFVNAQLRRESGAAIASSEFENAAKQYFPQPGDSAQVIEQKRQARQIAIENMKQQSGGAYKGGSVGEQDINDILSQFGL